MLSPNEFVDHRDLIGLFRTDPVETPFFFAADLSVDEMDLDGFSFGEIMFVLSPQVTTYEREAYTLMTLIADVGGFNGAIIILPSFFMSIYSSKMYEESVSREIPTKRRKRNQTANSLRNKLKRG